MKVLFLLIVTVAMALTEEDRELDEFAEGNTKFTVRLYQELLKSNNANFICSPLSAEVILALTQAGAKGKTAEEFTTSLSLPASQETTQKAMKRLLPHLKKNSDGMKLLSANKLYINEGFKVKEDFQKIATNIYEAKVENVDFKNNVKAASTINKWVEDQTNNKIHDLIQASSLDEATRLVLVNALYFSGKWVNPFEKIATSKEKFYTSESDSVEVDMMHGEDNFNYYECTKHNVKYLEMPYQGGDISMLIILPNEKDGLSRVENNLEDILKHRNLTQERVAVTLPKWKVESTIQLNPILQSLGLRTPFDESKADFSGISEKEKLFISTVVQKAFIDVNEYGTEAAAATAVGVVLLSSPIYVTPTKVFKADHPFLFVIRDSSSGVVFFGGRVSK